MPRPRRPGLRVFRGVPSHERDLSDTAVSHGFADSPKLVNSPTLSHATLVGRSRLFPRRPPDPGDSGAARVRGAQWGERRYKGVFSLVSAIGLVMIVVGFMIADPNPRVFAPFPQRARSRRTR
jgi:hypothetical protein